MQLYAHQQKIISDDPLYAGIFQGTGSGKTRTALMLARGRTLVIAPKTQVEDGNWIREYFNINKETREKHEMYCPTIISKETFRRDHATLPAFDTVIVDEAHTCLGVTPNIRWRNKKAIPKTSQIFEALQNYLVQTKPERFYLCTATIMRSPMTVWGAATLLGREWDWYKFRSTYYFQLPMPGREVWSVKNDEESKNRLASNVCDLGYTGRLEDFFDVPDQTFKTINIELTPKQKARIKDMRLEHPEPIVRIGKIHQIENGVLSGDEFSPPEYFDNSKIEKILELANEFPRMIIFAKYRAQMVQIANALQEQDIRILMLNGDTKDRGSLILEAKKRLNYVFLCQAQISAGWELPGCPVMIFASRTYSWVDYEQSLGRIQRANKIKKNLYINLVVKGGVDTAVDNALKNKQDFNERIYAKI